jgi:hypothetical protein
LSLLSHAQPTVVNLQLLKAELPTSSPKSLQYLLDLDKIADAPPALFNGKTSMSKVVDPLLMLLFVPMLPLVLPPFNHMVLVLLLLN